MLIKIDVDVLYMYVCMYVCMCMYVENNDFVYEWLPER